MGGFVGGEAPDDWQVEGTGRDEVLDWQNVTEAQLPNELADYLVLDLHAFEVDGRAAGSRLAHHVDAQGRALVMEQVFTEVDGLGLTLTATVDTPRYPVVAEEMTACCASLRGPSGVAR
ncbi:MAG: hypothetical protein DI571_10815 [Arsenicicoccus sp.]|nr:MAG: hypothetical protein DI571_10815 [Arsenicicoccus sp.]